MLRGGYSRTTEDETTEPPGIEGVMLDPGRAAVMVTVYNCSSGQKGWQVKKTAGTACAAHAPADFPNLLCSLARTFPGTKPLTLPPRDATSRTSFAET